MGGRSTKGAAGGRLLHLSRRSHQRPGGAAASLSGLRRLGPQGRFRRVACLLSYRASAGSGLTGIHLHTETWREPIREHGKGADHCYHHRHGENGAGDRHPAAGGREVNGLQLARLRPGAVHDVVLGAGGDDCRGAVTQLVLLTVQDRLAGPCLCSGWPAPASPIHTVFMLVNSRMPNSDSSRPYPLFLTPPKGSRGSEATMPLTKT